MIDILNTRVTLIITRTTLRRLVMMARITTSGRRNTTDMRVVDIPITAKRDDSLA